MVDLLVWLIGHFNWKDQNKNKHISQDYSQRRIHFSFSIQLKVLSTAATFTLCDRTCLLSPLIQNHGEFFSKQSSGAHSLCIPCLLFPYLLFSPKHWSIYIQSLLCTIHTSRTRNDKSYHDKGMDVCFVSLSHCLPKTDLELWVGLELTESNDYTSQAPILNCRNYRYEPRHPALWIENLKNAPR